MYKAYKFRLYPNNKQVELIQKTFGCSRFVYNYYLGKKKMLYEDKKENLSCFYMIKDLKNLYIEYPFLKEVDSCSLRCSLFHLEDAFKRFNKGLGEYPKFRGKYTSRRSYKTNYFKTNYQGRVYENIKLDLKRKVIILPKLGEVNIRGYRDLGYIHGKVKSATIEQLSTGKYYVSVLVEENTKPCKVQPKKIVGIDLGVKDIVITSDNEKIANPNYIQKYEKRIKRFQKELSRRVKGSNNYYKTKKKLAILYQKLKNARKYLIHQITKKLVVENDIIVTEDLNVKGMIEEKKLSKQLTNVSLGDICRVLEYKARVYGKRYIKIDRYYPSSQRCSRCGYKNEKVKDLNVREWTCPECGSYHDRDFNASYNIMFEGLKIYIKRYM